MANIICFKIKEIENDSNFCSIYRKNNFHAEKYNFNIKAVKKGIFMTV